MAGRIPENIISLHAGEEDLRAKALTLIEADARLALHLDITEHVMDLFDTLRKFPTEDEDLKVIQVMGIRTFNAFASGIKLMLSGYSQKSALVMRDILECTFLVDLFRTDRSAISRWRAADKQARLKEFKPIKVREALDARDGFTMKKRAAMYDLFSELAGHPSMLSIAMLRPNGMDVHCGPFLDPTALEAVLSEMGRLAVQAGRYSERSYLGIGGQVPKSDWLSTLERAPGCGNSIRLLDWQSVMTGRNADSARQFVAEDKPPRFNSRTAPAGFLLPALRRVSFVP